MRRSERRLDELDKRRGMGPAFWAQQKRESERRMSIIDDAPPEWRLLVNIFDPDSVAELAGEGRTDREVYAILRERDGVPI
jgi:hypothetical protein